MELILESKRLLFRPHVESDLDDFCAMEMDMNVRRYVGGYPRSREAAEQRFPRNQFEKMRTDRMSHWATVLKTDNGYIGRCGLAPHHDLDNAIIPGEASLGYYIAHKYWGQGFATEAGRALIDFGFVQLALNRIVASVEEGNDPSFRVLQKLGFVVDFVEKGQRSFCHFILERPV